MTRASHSTKLNEVANARNWKELVRLCEEYELDVGSRFQVVPAEQLPLYTVHLCAYLIVNDL
jgi:hypothetical protein